VLGAGAATSMERQIEGRRREDFAA